ncbi:transglycosylase domain-containing protein [Arenibacter sp. F20364]|uniref:penicillin-binding protein 1A n=1 Tax=Arenibacter sp. F20364 TaxID=2926415 RepID=UPI001FF6BA9C|nr:transglycosylase domain-containing protein [Arenibacter sp. F20364]MCK0192261.1 transglycosylase domain-containing protein [Arenibacter sp. F20364]
MFKKIKNPFLRLGIITILIVGSGIFLLITGIYLGAWGKLPNKRELSDFKYQRASEVYSTDSVLIGKYFLFDRQPIQIEMVPKNLIKALVAIEDERFYDHSGIDYRSLLRVAFKTILMQDQSAGGGSTLSQQLAKNLYPRERSGKFNLAISKLKEMIIASRLESIYSKEEILMLYLNTVSFGDNTFGIESASLKFFNKSAKELELQESATLVGMLKATYGYNPRVFPKNSLHRRNLVLQSMYSNNFISQKETDSLKLLPLQLNYREYDYNEGIAPYFREEVRKQMLSWAKAQREKGQDYNIYTSGLKIYTTLDSKMQILAEEAMRQHMKGLQNSFEKSYGKRAPWISDKKLINKIIQRSEPYKKMKNEGMSESAIMDSMNLKKEMQLSDWNEDKIGSASTIDSLLHYLKFLNTGSLSMDPKTGAVKTWLGGINFKHFKYDHISQSRRQVGSAFKPIVYTAALENGIMPCTYFSAQEVAYKNMEGWSPSNSGKKDEAYLNYSMEQALSNSVNTVAVKVLEKTGIPKVIQQAQRMGITTPLPSLPSLALGTAEIKINELAGAYASFLNNGKSVTPFLIEKITNENGSIIETFKPIVSKKRAFSEETGQIMLEMMKATVNSGTAARIRSTYGIKNDIAGKTGTTQNNKDAWFVALTPKLLNITWVGLDNHEIGFSSTSLGQGANAALPIFALWMQKLNADNSFNYLTKAKFPAPSSEVMNQLDCDPVKRDGFFKRLFKNPKKKKTKDFKTDIKA